MTYDILQSKHRQWPSMNQRHHTTTASNCYYSKQKCSKKLWCVSTPNSINKNKANVFLRHESSRRRRVARDIFTAWVRYTSLVKSFELIFIFRFLLRLGFFYCDPHPQVLAINLRVIIYLLYIFMLVICLPVYKKTNRLIF